MKRNRKRKRRWIIPAVIVFLLISGVWITNLMHTNKVLYANTKKISKERILIFAPHPDDELLGNGGLIQDAKNRGDEVIVVLMTNGDG